MTDLSMRPYNPATGSGVYDDAAANADVAASQAAARNRSAGGPAPATATAGANSATTAAQNADAFAMLSQILDSYGLSGLDSWVQSQLQSGASASQITLLLRQQPAFQQRFPGIALRQAAGLPPISPTDYVNYEDSVAQLWHSAGLPAGFHDDAATIGNLIGQDVSIAELNTRVQQGYEAAITAPTEVRQHLQDYYGVDAGHLAAFFLDPDTATPLLMKKYQAALVGGTAAQAGYSGVGVGTAEQLAALGLSTDQYRQGFSQLGHETQLFGALPGTAETQINPTEQIAAQFEGDAGAQLDILRRQQQRQAAFQGGEQFTETQTGVAGLGTAQRT